MATPLVVLLIACALLVLVALVGSAIQLFGSTRRLAASTRDVRDELGPQVAAINDDVAVAQRELERVQDAIDDLKSSRNR